jgi:hypothetical protein
MNPAAAATTTTSLERGSMGKTNKKKLRLSSCLVE